MPQIYRLAMNENDSDTSRKNGKFSAVNRQYLKFLYQYTKPYIKSLVWAFLVSIPLAALGAVLPWAFNRVTKLFGENASISEIVIWMAIGLGSVSVRSVLAMFNKYILTMLHVRITTDMRNEIYERIQKRPLEFHMHKHAGKLGSIISNDTQVTAGGVMELFTALWQSPASILCLAGAMLYFNPILSLLAIGSIPLLSFFVTFSGNRARKAEWRYFQHESNMLGVMIESLTNVKQVKSFGLEKQQKEKIAESGRKLIRYRKRTVLLKSIIGPTSEILNVLAITIMAIIAYFQLQLGQTTPAAIVGCLTAALSLRTPVKTLSNCMVSIQRSVAAMQRIKWFCGDQKEKESDLKKIEDAAKCIELKGISFSYNGKNTIFSNISFKARTGERIAIFGPSGVGKTTIVELILGFYQCSSGKILVDGIDLATLDPYSWRKQVGVVTQDPFLFHGTIEENIRYGYQDADQNRILEAARLAGCDEILERLPGGIRTMVGERGSLLSGGERKRIALARALIRPISLLILDEVTSELDSQIEEEILTSVDQLAENLIVINVSHRISVLRHSDRSILLKNGEAVECDPKKIYNEDLGKVKL